MSRRVSEDATFLRIIRLAEEDASSKAPVPWLADRAGGIFVPCVIGLALATFACWLLAGAPARAST